jgi:acetylornithine deacetylase/succinyl-diaminopimelate desuccinylase-like protein
MIASLIDPKTRKITIPGFYDDVADISQDEKDAIARIPFSIQEYKEELKVNDVLGEEGYNTIERTTVRPTLDVNGIKGGYQGEGAKTVLPSKASAKISMRLVPNQKTEKISQLFTKYFKTLAPAGISV